MVRASRAGSLGLRIEQDGPLAIAVQSPLLRPWLTRALGARPHKSASCLWRVPYPLELCHTRHDTPGQPWHRGVGRNGAPLAPVPPWCFCDTSVQGRPRRNPTAGKVAMAKKLYRDRTSSMPAILQTLHISRATLYRWINAGGGMHSGKVSFFAVFVPVCHATPEEGRARKLHGSR
jgi:hypothetical protein